MRTRCKNRANQISGGGLPSDKGQSLLDSKAWPTWRDLRIMDTLHCVQSQYHEARRGVSDTVHSQLQGASRRCDVSALDWDAHGHASRRATRRIQSTGSSRTDCLRSLLASAAKRHRTSTEMLFILSTAGWCAPETDCQSVLGLWRPHRPVHCRPSLAGPA